MNVSSGLNQKQVDEKIGSFGYNEIPEEKKKWLLLLARKFWGISAWMLELIILLSFWLDRRSDAYIVIGLLLVNAIIGFFQEYTADNAVESLKKKLQINVKVLRDGIWKSVEAREVVPEDVVRLRKGDFVAADLTIMKGQVGVDQSSLTGESLAVEKQIGQAVYAGSIITYGELTGTVTATGSNTFYGKTVSLLKIAKPKSHIEEVIVLVVKWLLAIVACLLGVALVAAYFQGVNLFEIIPLMLVLLLGAIPVALTAMFTVSMAIGSRQLVEKGVLVTHLNAPDDAASMDILCVDKTGTLTTNKLTVAETTPAKGYSENDLLLYGALASQEANRDAIDAAFIEAAKRRGISASNFVQLEFYPFDPNSRKTEAIVEHDYQRFKVIKGSFKVVANLCHLNQPIAEKFDRVAGKFAARGYRTIAVATNDLKSNPHFVGLVGLHDPPREDSKKTISDLKALGLSIKMLTGDSNAVASQMAKNVGIGEVILNASQLNDSQNLDELLQNSDGVSEVFPEDKYKLIKALQIAGHVVGMTGDGVNDAPALKQAEVGIAVNNATDVAKGAASVVLTMDGLSGIIQPIQVGRMIFERINIWILNKFARTVLKTFFVVICFLVLGKLVVSATAMLIMIFMTDFVKIFLSTDNVRFKQRPAKWQIEEQVMVGVLMGVLMTLESLVLLYIGLEYFDLENNEAALQTYSFGILLFFALFSVLIVREKGHFWSSAPSKTLASIIATDVILGCVFSTTGLLGFEAIPLRQPLFIIGFTSICTFVLNDYIKCGMIRRLGRETNSRVHIASSPRTYRIFL